MKKILVFLIAALFVIACNTKPTPQVTVEKEKQPMPVLSTKKALVAYLLLSTAFWYCGKAIAANMPIISTTTNNSIRVKP